MAHFTSYGLKFTDFKFLKIVNAILKWFLSKLGIKVVTSVYLIQINLKFLTFGGWVSFKMYNA